MNFEKPPSAEITLPMVVVEEVTLIDRDDAHGLATYRVHLSCGCSKVETVDVRIRPPIKGGTWLCYAPHR
jgi:hypothetical protein